MTDETRAAAQALMRDALRRIPVFALRENGQARADWLMFWSAGGPWTRVVHTGYFEWLFEFPNERLDDFLLACEQGGEALARFIPPDVSGWWAGEAVRALRHGAH